MDKSRSAALDPRFRGMSGVWGWRGPEDVSGEHVRRPQSYPPPAVESAWAQAMAFYTYLLASSTSGTLYIGMTDDLARRVYEHREKARPGFTKAYGVTRLVWYEVHDSREAAFQRERQIKKWRRAWKIELIQQMNPEWRDLYETLQN